MHSCRQGANCCNKDHTIVISARLETCEQRRCNCIHKFAVLLPIGEPS